ncbi:uncharacterized protein LOC115623634 [Scaptodrosophila lebanonensis]|uniref:Uncharacterized protein LOC115623634 n=1 Tax=Drosophila lebanonensis TaxID=7225 RepID=A0A6J2TET3_DROLE|nr:uncharacterized protein LOC115623634 [Scaptodrosophila lebanonensis]
MLDKLKFNNLVITNKKQIQQARVQTISKLVHRLRKIKDALSKQPDNEKHKDRMRKNYECVAYLKSLKAVDIVRHMLLQQNSNHSAVVTNGRATPEEVSMALLALNKVMQQVVTTFQTTLKLSIKADAPWRQEIMEASKRRAKVERTEAKRRKRKELKEQKAQSRKREEWLEQNKVDSAEEDGKLQQETENANKIEEPIADLPKTKKSQFKQRDQQETKKPQLKPQPKENKTNIDDVELSSKEENYASHENTSHISTSKRKEPEEERPTHVVDPFFITETGEHYMSTAVVLSDNAASEEEDESEPLREQRRNNKAFGKRQEQNGYKHPRTGDLHGSAFETLGRKNDGGVDDSHGDLHPSWIAKQRLKPRIREFAGTKIKFDDESGTNEENKVRRIEVHKSITKPTIGETNDNNAGLHPSWIAKQRLKPRIREFAGTKIKFDKESGANEKKFRGVGTQKPITKSNAGETDDSNANLHPSWIAKQRLKPRIAEFVGTKIKFDED